MTYVVVYEQAPDNWTAYVPALPGCIAAGDTRDEVERLIREAIVLYLDALREQDTQLHRSRGVGHNWSMSNARV